MIDQHVHTALCCHAGGTVEEYVAAAWTRGVTTLTFTDHLALPDGYPDGYTMRAGQFDQYVGSIRAAAAGAEAAGGPEVLCGIEADWIPESADVVPRATEAHPLDIVLGSVHFIDDWAFDDPDLIDRYGQWDIDRLWERYFNELEAAAHSGLFDVMAHPDLVKKFGFFPGGDPTPLHERAAEAFSSSGVAVEVNTAGLRKPVGEVYPAVGLLRACRRRGVPATVGSDAHLPGEVAADFDVAAGLLREAGYRSIVVFRARRAEEVALW